jgi:hypothetical protein
MKKIKTICLWCGKNHKRPKPKKCLDYSKLMSKICKKIDVWKAFAVLHRYGIEGLRVLAVELNIKVAQ